MSSVSSPYSSNSRVTGMYSNYDTDALVKSMCSNQQTKVDKQNQKITTYEWYNEAVETVKDTMEEFSNTYLSAMGSSSMLKSSAYSTYSAKTSSTSNAVSLTASSSAAVGNISVKVIQLAEQANVSSSGKVSKDGTKISSSNTATLAELSFANALKFDSSGKISFSINGKSFSFSSDTKLQTMLNTINNDKDANVTMKYSRLTDKFTIEADSGGKDSKVSIVNLTGNAFGTNSAFQINSGTVINGKNAKAEINGTAVEQESNKFEFDGITYELNKVTAGTSEETIDFTVKRDYSSTVETVTKFIEAYNTMMKSLTTLVEAKDYSSDYPPLTDEQKEAMTEKQIEAWESKAKNGVLRKDSNLSSLINTVKNAFFSEAGGTGKTAASIGITTASYFSSEKGSLVIDTAALEKALEENPEDVISIFTGGNSSAASSEKGVIYKIRSSISTYKTDAKTSVDTTSKKITTLEKGLVLLEDKLDDLAEKYYKKFSAMETALSSLNSQSSYISQLFS